MVRIIFILVILAAIVPSGIRRQIETLRLVSALSGRSMEERRSFLFGRWYEEAQRLARTIPPAAPVDLVMIGPDARDVAVLSGALLHPRDCRFFDGWEAWKRRERARFLHDDRAANAVPGPPPQRAEFLVVVDPAAEPPLQIVAGAP